jgi:hypothetical protein
MCRTLKQISKEEVVEHLTNVASKLLLARMEALQLEPKKVGRIEADVFSDLMEACANCDSKELCEQDLTSSRPVGHDGDSYCFNSPTLNSLAELPWFRTERY